VSDLIRDDDGISNPSTNTYLHDLIEREIARNPSRRAMLKSGVALGVFGVFGSTLTACGGGGSTTTSTPAAGAIGFKGVPISTADTIVVPEGYTADVMYKWGDPIKASAPAFKGDASETWQNQEVQAGDNHDGINFFPFPGTDGNSRGLLAMNHEYINAEYIHNVANTGKPEIPDNTQKQLAAHGVSIIEVQRNAAGKWQYVQISDYNRRITGYTPITISGPAAGNDMLKTAADATGTEVLGTLNNCGAGQTPWGTYLTCEENFNGYFGTEAAGWTASTEQLRYGIGALDSVTRKPTGFGYGWHKGDARFDLSVNPKEPNRFGWVVEIDPYMPNSKPKKRTALGRFKHENAECVLSKTNKAVVYSGCDERNEYLYKFVSTGTYTNKASGADILDTGTLYVAKFDAGTVVGDNQGTGVWLPLVHNQNGLTAANGFASQAEVLIKARQAADRVGATMMDRPEWVAANPTKPGEVFLACTNSSRRGAATPATSNAVDGSTAADGARPAVDEANPRAGNTMGHIIRINEMSGDAAATTFIWDIFVLAGNPEATGDKKGSSFIDASNTFNSPDGIQVDPEGRLWIQSDGSYGNTGDYKNQGNNQMLVADIATKKITRFLTGPSGCEVTGVCWTPDARTMFINIQHPGEISGSTGTHPNAPAAWSALGADAAAKTAWVANNPTVFSKWPDGATGGRPRSATVVIRKNDGGVIGT
jgi:secreted PhoX family phosphatase